MARLSHRAAEDHRSTDQPHGAWRERIGRFPSGDSVDAGHGFSGKPTTTGWGPERIARAWAVLMKRLGYTRYAAQGGDWGALIVALMGVQAAPGLIGIHTNIAGAIPPEIDAAAFAGAAPPSGLDDEEKQAFSHVPFSYKHGRGYAQE